MGAMVATLLQVALGGAIGASLRWAMALALAPLSGPGFPVAILAVNVIGSFLMGLAVTAFALRGGAALAPFLTVGVLGGFTTFSAFSLEAYALIERGDWAPALAYILLSVAGSIVGLALGVTIARGVLAA